MIHPNLSPSDTLCRAGQNLGFRARVSPHGHRRKGKVLTANDGMVETGLLRVPRGGGV